MSIETVISAEQSLLGALLLDSDAYPRIAGVVERSQFVRPHHAVIWDAIGRLVNRRARADVVTVADELQRTGRAADAGGLAYLSSIARQTPSAVNVETYAGLVRDRARVAEAVAIGRDIQREGQEGATADELIATAIDRLVRLQVGHRRQKGAISAAELMTAKIEELDRQQHGEQVGLMVGLEDFDRVTAGLRPGQLIVLAGRPGTGKTALMLNIASHVSRTHPVLVFEAEMTGDELVERAAALHGPVSHWRLRRPQQLTPDDWKAIGNADAAISDLKLWIDDAPSPPLSHVRAEAYAVKARHGLSLLMVDYAQLVKGSAKVLRENVGEVIYGLKALAKELEVPVVALAQLNRGVESRDDKRPRISDLKESGDIEQAADVIGLLYCHGKNDKTFTMRDVLECDLAKVRSGEPAGCLWRFQGDYSRIKVLEDGPAAQYRRLLAQGAKSAAEEADI